MSELNKKFHGYPIVNVRSDAEAGWNNKRGFLGKFTTLQKRKDDKHILMARIDNFASSLKAAVYKANNHYSRDSPPMTINNVYEFTDKWNQAKMRGMDCTREQMMR